MERPAINPGEFVLGYLGRVARLNGKAERKEFGKELRKWGGAPEAATRWDHPSAELLAKVADLDTETFVMRHTCMPLLRAVVIRHADVNHGAAGDESRLSLYAPRTLRNGAYFCVQCVEQTFKKDGEPHWQREHQLPGRHWCLRHLTPLAFVERRGFMRSPTSFHYDHQAFDDAWVGRLRKNVAIGRFIEISSHFLTRSTPLDETNVWKTMRARLAAHGLHTGRGHVRSPVLSDLLLQAYDPEWLKELLPGFEEKTESAPWRPVDEARPGKRAGVPAIYYAVCFAALYVSSSDAIKALTANPDLNSIKKGKFSKAYINFSEAERAPFPKYRFKPKAPQNITKKTVPTEALPVALKITAESEEPSPANMMRTLCAFLQDGVSLEQACSANQVSKDHAEEALRRTTRGLASSFELMQALNAYQSSKQAAPASCLTA